MGNEGEDMIKKILKLKNLGIFIDYKCDPNLPEFKRYNLIYGWNGSGKTTLSQLFSSLETGESETFPNLEYKIQTTDGDLTQDTPYNKKIRVFNQEYISDNINLLEGKAKPIFILGKENKELDKAIRRDEKILYGDPEKEGDIGKIKELQLKQQELERKEEERGKKFTDVAKIISLNTSGTTARNYRKNNAENAFSKLKSKEILTEEEIHKLSLALKQQEKPLISELSVGDINKKVNEILDNAKSLMQRTVESVVINRLRENPEISFWVEQGLALHIKNNSSNCEFCDRPLPSERISELLAHFNDADRKIKEEIDTTIKEVDQVYNAVRNISCIDKANLYDELQPEYLNLVEQLSKCKEELLNSLITLKEEIEKKKANTTVSMELSTTINTESFISAVDMINAEISKHNSKTNNFSQVKAEAATKLENHYLSEIYDDVKKLESEILNIKQEIDLLKNGDPNDPANIGIIKIQQRIIDNKNKLSNSGLACDEINKQLKTFLGRDELTFEVADEGYIIKRKGKIAKNLSEGEKTAIAFVYFTIHLKDQDFNIDNGIIVVDDPICSLDSNSLFQAFAFLKNAVKDGGQVFILTHNFDFLRLLLNWLGHHKMKPKSMFFMVKNFIVDGERVATIANLDPLLENYQNEYHYLFSLLFGFQSDGTIAKVYHIPNVARKVLEYFLMIMIPNDSSLFEKLEKIAFDENKKTAIYKFVNDQSHITGKGFDPSLVQECQNCVRYLLEMMEKVFPAHYEILTKSVGVVDIGKKQVAATKS